VSVPRISERRFMQQVVDLAKLLKWRVYHTHDSRHSPAGFPDLVLVRRPRVLFVELKVGKNVPTDEQIAWLLDLHDCGQVVHIWRPEDWPFIELTLKGA
jgi:hypothetical protein